jgi:methylglutaconyl-CoA hydratase
MNMVEFSVENRIGFITLNRPEKRNALSFEMVTELREAFDKADNDDRVKVIILKANGESFCAGADLAYLQQLQKNSFDDNLADSLHLKNLFLSIYTANKIVIAQVEGHAIAGGCGLATVCDFVFSVPDAKFGYTEVKIGFVPAIVMVFLLRKVGEQVAKELLLSGDLYPANEAKEMGLINFISETDKIESDVLKFAGKLVSGNSLNSMKVTKHMISKVPTMQLDEALEYAARKNAEVRASEDCQKGISAFLGKEKIMW